MYNIFIFMFMFDVREVSGDSNDGVELTR